MAKRDIDAIEGEIDQTLNRLADTIDQLAYRASPKTIVRREADQVKSHFFTPAGEVRTDTLIKVGIGVVGMVLAIGLLRKVMK